MIFQDRVYGEIESSDDLFLEIIKLDCFKRLKKVDQSGYYMPYFKHIPITRYEHSLGCFFLLGKYNALREEKINGLIHDVSHSAFSHCVDYVLANSQDKQSYQDDIFRDYVLKTDIPIVLKRYGLDVEYILNEVNFPLQEKDLPDLCADRIDYSLRSLIAFGENSRKDVLEILDSLMVLENDWVFDNFEIAQKYANCFNLLNQKHYCGIDSAIMFQRVANYLKYALEKNYIIERDLYKTDDYVIQKINDNLKIDDKLNILWDDMNNKYRFESNLKNYDYMVLCKSRIIDPKILYKDKIVKLSDINLKWKEVVFSNKKPVKHFIKTYVKRI